MKILRSVFLLLLFVFITGCSSNAKETEDLKWFNSEEKAKEYGLKHENIKENDVLEMTDLNNERLVIYKFKVPEGEGINVAQIVKKNKKYSWHTISNRIVVKSGQEKIGNMVINVKVESEKGHVFKLYSGVVDDPKNPDIAIREEESVTPTIVQETGMYYAIKSLK